MTRASRLVLALACAGMSAGCVTTYEDGHLRGGEAAVVRHEHPIESGVVIDALDGEHPGVRVIDEYRLAPGSMRSARMRRSAVTAAIRRRAGSRQRRAGVTASRRSSTGRTVPGASA